MKPKLLIPPVLALVVVVLWLGNGRQKIAALEKESAVLKLRLDSRSASVADGGISAKGKPTGKQAKEKEPIDWKQLAVQLEEMSGGPGSGDMRSMIRLQRQLQAMEKEDIVAALDEIAGLDLSDRAREILEQMLISQLCQKSPETALTRYFDRINEERGAMNWQLANALKEWTRKDPASATSWFDEQIAAGRFDSKSLDGRSQPRLQFEGALIANLLGHDSSAAAARLEGLPESQRSEMLGHYAANDVREEDQFSYAEVVRKGLPEAKQGWALGQIASHEAREEGYEEVTGYFDRIKATPAERAACMEQVVDSKIEKLSHKRKINADDIDAMRTWISTQSPESTDRMTGSALARSTEENQRMDFSEASALALKYHEASGNDEVLVGFLSTRVAPSNQEQALELAAKISDPTRREEFLKRFTRSQGGK